MRSLILVRSLRFTAAAAVIGVLGACADSNTAGSVAGPNGPEVRNVIVASATATQVRVCLSGASESFTVTTSQAPGISASDADGTTTIATGGTSSVSGDNCTLVATETGSGGPTQFIVTLNLNGATLNSVTCNDEATAGGATDCTGNQVQVGANKFHGSTVIFNVTRPSVINGCTFTQGFFKNHEDDVLEILSDASAPFVSSDNRLIISFGADGVEGGTGVNADVTLTAAQIDAALETPVKGDFRNALRHQLITALLNVANGATASAAVSTAITDAQILLAANTSTLFDSAEKAQASSLNGILSTFNEGNAAGSSSHCDDEEQTA